MFIDEETKKYWFNVVEPQLKLAWIVEVEKLIKEKEIRFTKKIAWLRPQIAKTSFWVYYNCNRCDLILIFHLINDILCEIVVREPELTYSRLEVTSPLLDQ